MFSDIPSLSAIPIETVQKDYTYMRDRDWSFKSENPFDWKKEPSFLGILLILRSFFLIILIQHLFHEQKILGFEKKRTSTEHS